MTTSVKLARPLLKSEYLTIATFLVEICWKKKKNVTRTFNFNSLQNIELFEILTLRISQANLFDNLLSANVTHEISITMFLLKVRVTELA